METASTLLRVVPMPFAVGMPRYRDLAGLAWLIVVLVGLAAVYRHAKAPGDPGAPARTWPTAAIVAGPSVASGRSRLAFFVHPRCPCTRVAVGELARLVARAEAPLDVDVLVFRPAGEPASWARSASRAEAAAIPGVRVLDDEGGALAARFGVRTSGHALLYGPDGALRFSGGITTDRGHAGDNAGLDAATRLVSAPDAGPPATYPVFGCSILPTEPTPDGR